YAGSKADGFVLDHGSDTTLDVPGSTSTVASGINDSGQIVGYYEDAGGTWHGFLLDQGSYTTLDVPGSERTYATGINASGQIVGWYPNAIDEPPPLAFLLDNGTYTSLDLSARTHRLDASDQIVET